MKTSISLTRGELAQPSSSTLLDQVLGAVKAQRAPLTRVASASGSVATRPQAILALLVYHYAAGVLGSREIERRLWADGALRVVCNEVLPGWRQLRRFRRLNHAAVVSCLAAVFARQASVNGASGDYGHLLASAEQRVNQALWQDDLEDD